MTHFIERNPSIVLAIATVVVVLVSTLWTFHRNLSQIGLSMVPTERLESLEAQSEQSAARIEQLETRLKLTLWLIRECPDIRRTMDDPYVFEAASPE